MLRFQALCRLQLHKVLSEQMTTDAALIDPLWLAHPDPLLPEAKEEARAKPRTIAFPGSMNCPGDPVHQFRDHTKEKTACLSQ